MFHIFSKNRKGIDEQILITLPKKFLKELSEAFLKNAEGIPKVIVKVKEN